MTSWTSTSAPTPLLNLGVLQSWVHRPQALAKCSISDVYGMRALVKGNEGLEVSVGYSSRDVFMLNQFPCRMVELVGWVAGVDEKEKTQTIYLDDGDGKHVLPVTVRLPLVAISPSQGSIPTSASASRQTQSQARTETQTQGTQHFISAKERKAARKAAVLEQAHAESQAQARVQAKASSKGKEKEYVRDDVRVGDTVRIRGRIDEYRRGVEWVRVVVVEVGSGGSVEVVDAEQQYHHLSRVMELHQTLYSRPFLLPPTNPVPTASLLDIEEGDTFGTFDSTMPSSEMTSEISLDSEQVKLCDPSKLRSSQLTDRTFRLYLLDHMSQETSRMVEEFIDSGELEVALKNTFPEYRDLINSPHQQATKSQRTPFKSRSLNLEDDFESTPRPHKTYQTRIKTVPGYNISSILSIAHLEELAGMVVDEQSRKEERRRRRRIRDGTATEKDHSQPQKRSQATLESQASMGSQGWRLSAAEKWARMERLVKWVIRGLSEEGVLVQIKTRLDSSNILDTDTPSRFQSRGKSVEAYLPLPESLLLPLLIPHIKAESEYRSKVYLPRSDPRYGNGVLVDEVLKRLRGCGEDGRWERVGEFCVEDALNWGMGRGLKRIGRGWGLA